jgi:endonuclease/exonuclease/phosphatase family metal-dependent hydrolase
LSAIIDKIQTLDATPTLLAGDLNEWSLRVGLGRLAHHFTIHAPGKSFHANIPMAALDRIALDQHLESRAAGVFDTAVARRASDHLPIWMDIGAKAG